MFLVLFYLGLHLLVNWKPSKICLMSAEATSLDSRYYVADPDVEHIPVKELLSKVIFRMRLHIMDSDPYSRNTSESVLRCLIPRRLLQMFSMYVTIPLS